MIEKVWHHFNANVYVAVFPLLVACQRSEEHHGVYAIVLVKIRSKVKVL